VEPGTAVARDQVLSEGILQALGEDMPLTPSDVRSKQFSTTRLRPGYVEEEVDAFLDEVEAELDRLIQENQELRAKLAESLRGARSPVPAAGSAVPGPGPELLLAAPPLLEPERRQADPAVRNEMARTQDSASAAARVLSLAQHTADQVIADARREADDTLGRARREAGEVLANARRQAEQISTDARARAESLEHDAQERHRQALGSLIRTREELERRVDDLHGFERQHRGRLTAYLQGQLRALEAGAADGEAFPAIMTAHQPGTPGALPDQPASRQPQLQADNAATSASLGPGQGQPDPYR
jgi:DivIVA domain-containing protein